MEQNSICCPKMLMKSDEATGNSRFAAEERGEVECVSASPRDDIARCCSPARGDHSVVGKNTKGVCEEVASLLPCEANGVGAHLSSSQSQSQLESRICEIDPPANLERLGKGGAKMAANDWPA